MGWTSYNLEPSEVETEVRRILETGSKNVSFKILKLEKKSSVYYAAVERIMDENPESRIVSGMVVLTAIDNSDYYNFSYRLMDETEGPCVCDCSLSLVNLLSPTDSEYALQWRERVKEKVRERSEKNKETRLLKSLPVGSKIKFNKWGTGYVILSKIFYAREQSEVWADLKEGYRYKVSDILKNGYQIVS